MATKETKVIISTETSKYERGMRNIQRVSKKTTQAISAHWAVTGIAVIAAWKTASLVKESALLAARFETLDIVMKQVGKNAGYSAQQMDTYDISLRKTGISMIESRNSLARMAQAQLDLSKATELGRIAQDAAVIGNINSSEAFQRMIYGIQSGQTEVLKTIGINVSFQDSYMKIAKATGRVVTSFTESEKAIIRQNTVIEYGSRIAGTYEASMTTAGKKIGSFTRYVEDFKVKMGIAFGPATVSLVDAATEAMKQFQDEISKPEAQAAMQAFASNLAKAVILLGKDLPSKVGAITEKLEGIWKVISYDPAILEWGLIGLALGGKKGALLMGSLAHMTTWADNLGKALGLVSAGILDISDVANANFKELQALIDNFEMPTELGGLELQAKRYREEIENLRRETEGQIFWPRGSKEALVETEKKLRDIQDRIAGIKQDKFVEGLITFKMPSIPSAPSMAAPEMEGYGGAVTQAEYDVWTKRGDLLNESDKEYLDYYDHIAKLNKSFNITSLSDVIAAEQAKFDIQSDFADQYFEMGKSQFDLERAQLDRQVEIWREALQGKNDTLIEAKEKEHQINKLFAEKAKEIADKEEKSKKIKREQDLAGTQSTVGAMADGFEMMAKMGGKHSKEMFKAAKAFKIVEAIMATRSAAIKAYESMLWIPYVGPALGAAAAAAVVAFGMAQVSMIKQQQPPSYDQGGISNARGIYQTGNIREAHIPIPSGGKIPVRMENNNQQPSVNIIMRNPVFQDVETQRQVFAQIAEIVATRVAPGAVVQNYNNDGAIRQMVRGGV